MLPESREITFFLLVVALLASGCASTFKPMNVSVLPYRYTKKVNDSLTVSYSYNIQDATLNKRYGNKERSLGFAAVALRIENQSSVPLTMSRKTFRVESPAGEKSVMSARTYASKVKQRVGAHMLHALWGPWAISWSEDSDGETDVDFIYIPVGLVVGIGNALRASNANKAHLEVMESYEIWGKEIPPGKVLYGIIPIQARGEEDLTFLYLRNSDTVKMANNEPAYVPVYKVKSGVYKFWLRPIGVSSYETTSKINIDGPRHFIEGRDSNNKPINIFPSDTESLISITSTGKRLVGEPDGDQWAFKIIQGKINAYFFLPDEAPKYITQIQKDGGPRIPFSPNKLIDMVNHDPDAIALINDGKYADAIILFNSKR